jgi:hypothetical protein
MISRISSTMAAFARGWFSRPYPIDRLHKLDDFRAASPDADQQRGGPG